MPRWENWWGIFMRFTIRDFVLVTALLAMGLGWWIHASRLQLKIDDLTVQTEMLMGAMEGEGLHPAFDDRTLRVTGFTKGGNTFETLIQKSNFVGPNGRPLSVKYPHAN